VPKVYWERTTHRALALEWVDGIKITDFAGLDAAGLDRAELARKLADSYFTQALDAGFFHADPHPGNIFAQPIPSEPGQARLVFVDFGMMGTITPRSRRGLRACFAGAVQADAALLLDGLDQLGFLAEEVDRNALEQVIAALLARFTGVPLSQLGQVGPNQALEDIGDVLYDQPFRLPAQFAFFGRAVGMLSGLTAALTPNFNFLEVAAPHAQQLISEFGGGGILGMLGARSIEQLAQNILREGLSVTRSLSRLPRQLDRLLEKAERGDLHIVIEPTIEAQRGRARARRRREGPTTLDRLNRPVPLWAGMVGVAGAGALAWLLLRRGRGSVTVSASINDQLPPPRNQRAARSRNQRSA
jgi:predicted unusual protein kinase regulating ubiquinone biosynthesis (AarF/ABC1/UbiB family)